jgi:queuine tRNA-ribosyltransferase
MNVATAAAIRGGISAYDLEDLKCQIMLSNTYHLHLRPGEDIVREQGGLGRFTGWKGVTLTDSGGFQVFSLAPLRAISELGVSFQSPIDGRRIFMGPEESMRIQSALGSTIAMAFDECIPNPAEHDYAAKSIARTTRWLVRCKEEMSRLNAVPGTLNKRQLLFGINQGATFEDLRIQHMQEIAQLDLDGYAIGGLSVGETTEEMYRIVDALGPVMPTHKIRYLMGVGTPSNIIECVWRGVDLFDCVMPSRNARHGHLFTWKGVINLNNARYKTDGAPIDEQCGCPVCQRHSRAYLSHLLRAKEMLGMRLAVMHNLYFYNTLMEQIRGALDCGKFSSFREEYSQVLSRRI